MDSWKVMTDKEKQEERQQLAETQARQGSPIPSTSSQTPSQSSQAQSEFVTPRGVRPAPSQRARTLFAARTPRTTREEEDVDSPGVVSIRDETDSD